MARYFPQSSSVTSSLPYAASKSEMWRRISVTCTEWTLSCLAINPVAAAYAAAPSAAPTPTAAVPISAMRQSFGFWENEMAEESKKFIRHGRIHNVQCWQCRHVYAMEQLKKLKLIRHGIWQRSHSLILLCMLEHISARLWPEGIRLANQTHSESDELGRISSNLKSEWHCIKRVVHMSVQDIIWIGNIQLPYFKFIRPRPSNLGREYFQVGRLLYTPQHLQGELTGDHKQRRYRSLDPWSSLYPPNLPLKQRKVKLINFDKHFKGKEDFNNLHQAEPLLRRPGQSVVHTARALLHEVPLVMTNSERDLIPFSGNTGTKILCTVSAFKMALGTSRPAEW